MRKIDNAKIIATLAYQNYIVEIVEQTAMFMNREEAILAAYLSQRGKTLKIMIMSIGKQNASLDQFIEIVMDSISTHIDVYQKAIRIMDAHTFTTT